jgi:putative nucleotidyltransferase with HDIG domain
MNNLDCVDKLIGLLNSLKFVNVRNNHHPEENVYNHSVQVFELALNNSNDPELIIAALFHDIGKLISSNNHANISADILSECSFATKKILWLVRNHLRIAYLISGEMKKRSKIDYLINHQYYLQLLELREYDLLGRKEDYQICISEPELKKILIKLVQDIPTVDLT